YKIKSHDSAIYVFYGVELQPESVRAINSELNITDEVIRFLITKPDLKKRAKAEAERAAKLKRNADRAAITDESNDE
ncbi:MAG: 30S ribosomal protein S6, partial [Candidatus Saccharimonadales bacterium]